MQVHYHITDGISRSINTHHSDMSVMVNQVMPKPPLFCNFSSGQLSCKIREIVHVESEAGMKVFARRRVPKRLMSGEFDSELPLPTRSVDHDMHRKGRINVDSTSSLEDVRQSDKSSAKIGIVNDACKATSSGIIESDRIVEGKEKEQLLDLGGVKRIKNLLPLFSTSLNDVPAEGESKQINTLNCDDNKPFLDNEHNINVDMRTTAPPTDLPLTNKQLRKSSTRTKLFCRDGMSQTLQALSKSTGHSQSFNLPIEKKHGKRDRMPVITALKATEKQKGNSTSVSPEVGS